MNNEEATRVSVNNCVRDSELEEIARLCEEADPGEWRVINGEVRRYGGAPMERPEASLRLMARAVTALPRLLRGIRVLEDALRSAWATATIARRELMEERERHEQDMVRASNGQTGPDEDIEVLAEAIELGMFSPRAGSAVSPTHTRHQLAHILRMWAQGVELQKVANVRIDIEWERKRRADEDRSRAEIDADDQRARAEARALLEELKLTKRERERVVAAARTRVAVEQQPTQK